MIRRGTSTLWFGQLAVPMPHLEHLDVYATVSDYYAALLSRCMRVCGLAVGLMVSYLSFCPQQGLGSCTRPDYRCRKWKVFWELNTGRLGKRLLLMVFKRQSHPKRVLYHLHNHTCCCQCLGFHNLSLQSTSRHRRLRFNMLDKMVVCCCYLPIAVRSISWTRPVSNHP